MNNTKEHRLNTIKNVFDTLAIIGLFDNPREIQEGLEVIKNELKEYPTNPPEPKTENLPLNSVEIADLYVSQAKIFCELYTLKAVDLQNTLLNVAKYTELTMSQLIQE